MGGNEYYILKIKKSKVPVYESSEYDEIVSLLGSKNRELKKLKKAYSKNNDEQINISIKSLEKEIEQLEIKLKKVKANLKQVTFKDLQAVKDTKSTINFYENQIKIIAKYIKKCEQEISQTTDVELIEKLKSNISSL